MATQSMGRSEGSQLDPAELKEFLAHQQVSDTAELMKNSNEALDPFTGKPANDVNNRRTKEERARIFEGPKGGDLPIYPNDAKVEPYVDLGEKEDASIFPKG